MSKLNYLLITSDQQHFMTMGYNNPQIKTPNLDRLAAGGLVSDRAYCPNPTCTPTRASMITGTYPSQHGAWTLGTKLPDDTQTLGDILLENGYSTTLIGKAHFQPLASTDEYPSLESYPLMQDLDFWKNYHKKFYGFETIELLRNHTTESHVGQHYAIWLEEKGFSNWRDFYLDPTGNMQSSHYRRLEKIVQEEGNMLNATRTWGNWEIPLEAHYNTWISERTNYHLEQAKVEDKPFFIWSSFPDPHPEYFVPEPYASMYDPELLDLKFLADNEIGNPLVEKAHEPNPDFNQFRESEWEIHGCHSHLQSEEELRKDVALYYGMVTFMDEHIGKILNKLEELELLDNTLIMFTTDHGHFYGQHGLIRKGPFHYEDAIKVPFISKLPHKVLEGERSEALLSLVDITPTVLDILGIQIPIQMTGISQKAVLFGEQVKSRDWIMCENRHERNNLNMRTFVNEQYKITVYQKHNFGDLYDLKNDPFEQNNLWDNPEYIDLKMQMLELYIDAELEKEPISMPRIKQA